MAATTARPLASSISPASSSPSEEQQSISPTATALARFEYEAGRTSVNSATKVLLVEWEDDASDGEKGEWVIEWKGRREVLRASGKPAGGAGEEKGRDDNSGVKKSPSSVIQDGSGQDKSQDPQQQQRRPKTHRLYFLLPPGAPVPASVSISFHPARPSQPTKQSTSPTTAPTLPAIFPPSLGATASTAGKKGVLHTLWAKSRLAALQAEIEAEEQANIEGIGLEMALQEQEWIIENFGLGAWAQSTGNAGPSSPRSPKSPGGFGGAGSARPRAGSGAATGAKPSIDTRTDRTDSGASSIQGPPTPAPTPISPASPASPSAGPGANPTSPSSSRLLTKMAGLRVGTTAQQSSASPPTNAATGTTTAQQQQQAAMQIQMQMQTPPQTEESSKPSGAHVPGEKNPLSPEVGDVAVGAFADIKGASPSSQQAAAGATGQGQGKTAVPVAPPVGAGVGAGMAGGMASLDSVMGGGEIGAGAGRAQGGFGGVGVGGDNQHRHLNRSDADTAGANVKFSGQSTDGVPEEDDAEADGDGEGLFALPMSPRNREDVETSPFSKLK
ncbi:MAG: hypothetical protein M1831_003858 [Alyxoria varia]|nr:MAG: hypothetical protein M1831_003858 [Alyxoria varia]